MHVLLAFPWWGVRWEDLRRLGQYVGREPKLDFLPTPQAECTTNPNAGC